MVVAGDFNAELAAVQGAAALPPAVPTGGIMTGLSGDFAAPKAIDHVFASLTPVGVAAEGSSKKTLFDCI